MIGKPEPERLAGPSIDPTWNLPRACDSHGRDRYREHMCESCGAEGETLVEVRRLYLTPDSWDTDASSRPADETEHWCEVCRLHYPHSSAA